MLHLDINKRDALPIHAQLTEQLKYHIEVGAWAPGTQLPTLRGIANAHRINYNTARLAYRELEQQGYIVSRQGRGTFVAPDPPCLPEEEHRRLFDVIDEAMAKAHSLGIGREVFARMVKARAKLHAPAQADLRLLFTECNRLDLDYYTGRIEARAGVPPASFLLEKLSTRPPGFFRQYDLITTTLFHVAELQEMVGSEREVLGLMIKPSYLHMVNEIARYPKGRVIGLIGVNENDAGNMKRALMGSGARHLEFRTVHVDQPDRLARLMEEADHLYASRHAIRARGGPWPGGKPVRKYEDELDPAALRMLRRQIADVRTRRLAQDSALPRDSAPPSDQIES